jgi:hypothetical protein
VQNTLATQPLTLVPGIRYWVRVTQFPTVPGNSAMVQAILLADSAGSPGSQVAQISPIGTTDAVTALNGQP